MKKIAITGVNKQDRIVLTHALSYLTGYDIVRQTAYPIQAIKYGWNNELEKCNWQELFLYVLASFTERIETEQQCEQYISNGSVFNELADMEAIVDLSACSKREKKEQKFMIAGMEQIITEYAVKEYDCVIHISNNQQDGNALSANIDINLVKLTENCEKVYLINRESAVTDILEKIITNPKVSPQSALERAKQEIVK
ncbi:MAG: hypothetical protein LBP83_06775 [Dysgonamonadaceae bacterium]|jgi:hypothetical protein|nr:hypothetical protein [Dysgonamonadaceae bacterium]